MEQGKNEDVKNANCCGADSNISCNCGSATSKPNKLRMLLFALIMLAAVGVGAYSLMVKSSTKACMEQGCSKTQNCCGK